MSKEQPRVPGMREVRPNREQRRHPEGGSRGAQQPAPDAPPPPDQVPVEPDPRAKNTGHGKKTADKWNQ